MSDIIPTTYIKSLPANAAIFLNVGVGGGKSYFCKHTLYDAARTSNAHILYLINRSNPRDQFKSELEDANKSNTITIKTYQALELDLTNGKDIDLSSYQYIVLDEYQYFAEDTTISESTEKLIPYILQTTAIRFFLSATPYGLDEWFRNKFNSNGVFADTFELPSDYSCMDIKMYTKTDNLHHLLQEIALTDEKAIVFINNIKKLHKLYSIYSDRSLFICSSQNKSYKNLVDAEMKQTMIQDEQLPCQFLFTTSCMEVGFNLKDRKVKHIICEFSEIDQIVQAIGRKRILDNEDRFTLYILYRSRQFFDSKLSAIEKQLKPAEELLRLGAPSYMENYPVTSLHPLPSILEFYVNKDNPVDMRILIRIKEMREQYDLHLRQKTLAILAESSFKSYIQKFFGKKVTMYAAFSRSNDDRMTTLSSYEGTSISTSSDRLDFARRLGYFDRSRNLITNLEDLNAVLEAEHMPFKIKKDRSRISVTKNGVTKISQPIRWVVQRSDLKIIQ